VLVAEIGVGMSRFPEALVYEVSLQHKTEPAT
jgi:hypothetical protein